MPNSYSPLSVAAATLKTTEDVLLDFDRAGWVSVVMKNGLPFISGHHTYRARFILHLSEKLRLTTEEITVVLSQEKPPYSLDKIPAILAQHASEQARRAAGG